MAESARAARLCRRPQAGSGGNRARGSEGASPPLTKGGKSPPQNHQPRGGSDPVQPLQRFLAAPAHPTVPQRTAEGARLPARSAHPPPAPREYVVQTATRKLLETPIVMTVHHTVPATHLIRPHKAHHPIPERKTLRGRLENIRCAFHDHHGYHAASPTASTNPNHPEPAEPSLPTNLAWDRLAAHPLPIIDRLYLVPAPKMVILAALPAKFRVGPTLRGLRSLRFQGIPADS